MNVLKTISVLNELLRVLCRSLPAYLADARPWMPSDDQQFHVAFDYMVADQRRYAQSVSDAIVEQGGRPDPGRFPMRFTAKNDLSLESLRAELIDELRQDVVTIERCAAELEDIAQLHVLAEEILGNTRGHLDILREMTNAP